MPGAPPRPNYAAFGSKMSELNAEKRKLIDEIKELQNSVRGDRQNNAELDEERNALRQRLSEIDEQRKAQTELRSGKNTEIAKIRQQRRETEEKLRKLQNELGGLRDVREIDVAIDYIMNKMETSGGGLAAERRTVKRLHQLEEAKALLMELQPLSERIQEAEEREMLLQLEFRDIIERIGILNKEFEDQLGVKREKDQQARSTGVNRADVYKKCNDIRGKINKLDEDMNTLRAEHNKATEAWDSWCVEARAKYQAKIEAEREARHLAFLERKNAARNAQKLIRARRRQNPYELEINACDTLVQYLVDKKRMTAREEEERKRREAAASFDPVKAAPAGTVVLSESKWTNAKPLSKAARKQQEQQKKQQQKKQEDAKPEEEKVVPASGSKNTARAPHVMQHPEEKMRLFQLVDQSPPLSLGSIDETIKSLQTKKKEYESHIVTGEPQLSSGESESEEEGEAEEPQGSADDKGKITEPAASEENDAAAKAE